MVLILVISITSIIARVHTSLGISRLVAISEVGMLGIMPG
jgi:hypothetical protein